MHIHTHTHCVVPLAGMLCCVGWDYLCDWISEEGVPEDNAMHSLHKTTPGVCLSEGRASVFSVLTAVHDANVKLARLGSSMVIHDAASQQASLGI